MREPRNYDQLLDAQNDAFEAETERNAQAASERIARQRQQNSIEDDEQIAMREVRRVADMLEQGRVTTEEAVWRLRNIENLRHSEEIARQQQAQSAQAGAADKFVAQYTGESQQPARSENAGKSTEIEYLDDRKVAELVDENTRKLIEQAKILQAQQQRLEATGRDPVQFALDASKHQTSKEAADAHIEDPGQRFQTAFAGTYNARDPLMSLGRAAMEERNAFCEQEERLTHQIKAETDVQTRMSLGTEKEIRTAEYLALTSERIASNAKIIFGSEQAAEAMAYQQRADYFSDYAENLRRQYRDDLSPSTVFVHGAAAGHSDSQGDNLVVARDLEAEAEWRRNYDKQTRTGQTVFEDTAPTDSRSDGTIDIVENTDAMAERPVTQPDRGEAAPTVITKPKERTGGRGGISM